MGTREIQPADIVAVYQQFVGPACEIINSGRECAPQLAIITLGPDPGEITHLLMLDPQVVNDLQESGRTKDAMVTLIRAVLDIERPEWLDIAPKPPADIVVHVTEAWALRQESKNDIPDTISDNPERTEVLLVSIFTRERSYTGASHIQGTGAARKVTPEPLHQGQLFGRFNLHDDGEPGHATH